MSDPNESVENATPAATVMGGALAASASTGVLLGSIDLLLAYAFDLPPSSQPRFGWKAFALSAGFFGLEALMLSYLAAYLLTRFRNRPGLRSVRHASVAIGLTAAYLLTIPVFGLQWVEPSLEDVLVFLGAGGALFVMAFCWFLSRRPLTRMDHGARPVTRLEQFMTSSSIGLPLLVFVAWLIHADLVGGRAYMAMGAGAVAALGLWAWAEHLLRSRWDGLLRFLMPGIFLVSLPVLYFMPVKLGPDAGEPMKTLASESRIHGICIGEILRVSLAKDSGSPRTEEPASGSQD